MQLEGNCDKYMERLPYNRLQALTLQAKKGDVVLFHVEKPGVPRHVGVYAGRDHQARPCFIHSYAQEDRGVIEQPMTTYWLSRVHALYHVEGVER